MIICPPEKCTGCMACMNICSSNAISSNQDEKGFYIPLIDDEKCIDCGLCKKICPVLKGVRYYPKKDSVLAAWAKEEDIRKSSSSGGVFPVLAKYIVQQGGTVYGAALDEVLTVKHISCENEKQLGKLQGSKYVQSNIGYIYRDVKKKLDTGKKVLFSGTSCQIAGLNAYIKAPHNNLFTIDVLCHGVPSPLYFSDYMKYVQEKEGKRIKHIFFKYKKPSWSFYSMRIIFQDGTEYIKSAYDDPYLCAFLKNYITRECCQECSYACGQRVADITIADFWGYVSEKRSQKDTDEGISFVIVSSEKGQKLLDGVSQSFITIKKSMKEAQEGNRGMTRPHQLNEGYHTFWEEYIKRRDFEWSIERIGKRTASKKNKVRKWIDGHHYLLPDFAARFYDRMKSSYISNKNN